MGPRSVERSTTTAVDGVATFTNLQISQADNGYTLEAIATGLSTATTSSLQRVGRAGGDAVEHDCHLPDRLARRWRRFGPDWYRLATPI